MTLPKLNALQKHWAKYPPTHLTAAVFAGVEVKAPAQPRQIDNLWQAAEEIRGDLAGWMESAPIMRMRLPA